MKTLFRRSFTAFMCVGTLIAGTQSWAADAQQKNTVSTEVKVNSKAQEKCKKPCDIERWQRKINKTIVSMITAKCLICPKWIILK